VTVTRVEERLAADAAPREVAAALGCATAAPLLWIERVAIDMLERPVELRLSWMATDRLRYAITLE
jgi:GntR family transcriptional regulator